MSELLRRTDAELIGDGLRAAAYELRMIDDATTRRIAGQLHTGQMSAMYSLASCGAIDAPRLQAEMVDGYHETPSADEARLWYLALAGYADEKGSRGPIEGWHRL